MLLSNEFLKALKKDILNNEMLEDKDIQILRFQFFKKTQILKIVIKSYYGLNNIEEDEFKRIVLKNLGFNVEIEILCYRDVSNVKIEEIIGEHWSTAVEEVARKFPLCRALLYSDNRKLKDKTIYISSPVQALIKHAKNKKVGEFLEGAINDIFNVSLKVEFVFDENLA